MYPGERRGYTATRALRSTNQFLFEISGFGFKSEADGTFSVAAAALPNSRTAQTLDHFSFEKKADTQP